MKITTLLDDKTEPLDEAWVNVQALGELIQAVATTLNVSYTAAGTALLGISAGALVGTIKAALALHEREKKKEAKERGD